ncbi:hypothetical protein VPH35_072449 [Triticum aestivum]|uniref:uncharacterized protein n=1 Tax=Triticum aestivum TaxID=4565 RepID=UPI001D00FC69|nr:uncharacterized protein LOC123090041 [Triticum aestivum]
MRGLSRFAKEKTLHTHRLASSPSHPRSHRRLRRRPRRPIPAISGTAQHALEIPTIRASLPSGQILRSRPLLQARNPTPVARVSGRASPACLRRPQMHMEHAVGFSHPPRSPSSRASSRIWNAMDLQLLKVENSSF